MAEIDLDAPVKIGTWLDKKNNQINKFKDISAKHFVYSQYVGALKFLERAGVEVVYDDRKKHHVIALNDIPNFVSTAGMNETEVYGAIKMLEQTKIKFKFYGAIISGGQS